MLTGNKLNAVWGSSARDVWAVGESGVIQHFDGVEWRVIASPVTGSLRAIAGSAADDVWVVGDDGVMLHFDGARWQRRISGTDVDFTDVSVVRRDLAWAVSPQQGVFRWDGVRWTPVRDRGGMRTLSAAAADDLWAIGETGLGPRTVRYDGRDWLEQTFQQYRLVPWAISALPMTEAWAVGWHRSDGDNRPGEALHLFAASSRLYTIDERQLYEVFARAIDDVWAVGYAGLIAHWDGFQWTKPAVPTQLSLNGVWASGPRDAWAVGDHGMILHYDGARWTAVDQPALIAANEVFALTATDLIARSGDQLWQRSAQGWQQIPGPDGALRSLLVRARDDMFVVSSTGVHHFDGRTWTRERDVSSNGALWATATDAWISAWYAVERRVSASDYRALPEIRLDGSPVNPTRVGWSRGPGDVYVVGSYYDRSGQRDARALMRYDGNAWTRMLTPSGTEEIVQLSGTADELAAIIDRGLYLYSRGAWSARIAENCWAISLTTTDGHAACDGRVLRRDGSSWVPQALPAGAGVSHFSVADGTVWTGGGAILYRRLPR
jgi:hypothetical protein